MKHRRQMTIADFGIQAIPLTTFKDVSVGDTVTVATDEYVGEVLVTRVCSDGMLYAKTDFASPEFPFPYECITPQKTTDDWAYEERN